MLVGSAIFAISLFGAAGFFPFGPSPAHSEQQNPSILWAAAAPGREPKGRELRVAASSPGAIKEVLVELNDRVKVGDLLIRLDDEELKAKLAAAKADAAVRMADRNGQGQKQRSTAVRPRTVFTTPNAPHSMLGSNSTG